MRETEHELYETETMAELCARQGRPREAIAIYHRLIDNHPGAQRHSRWTSRLEALERAWGEGGHASAVGEIPAGLIALPASPGVSMETGDETVTVAWALPTHLPEPTLELLFIQKTPAGVETTPRTLPLTAYEGRIAFAVPDLHIALAAVGRKAAGKFVPVAFTRQT
jgi:hypothetical protein